MKMRVKLAGTGTREDPQRVELPTASIVAIDEIDKRAIVEIPDDDAPDVLPPDNDPAWIEHPRGRYLAVHAGFDKAKWTAKLDRRYAESKGKPRAELV